MDTGNLTIDAETAFARQRRRRRRQRVTDWALRRPREAARLAHVEEELGCGPPAWRRELGLRALPVAKIVGTTERATLRSFDRSFHPPRSSRRRWERLWIAGRRGASLPPISVFRVGDHHFVSDGHHRVSVARALGMTTIDAEVTELEPLGP